MPELQQLFYKHCKYILYLLSIYFLGWGFTEHKTVFMGLILGTSVSLYNHWLLMRKTLRFSEAVASDKKVYSLGTLMRMAAVILAVYVAMKFPDVFHLISVIIGVMTAYAVVMIHFLFSKY
ncbi:ATP synthase subunit I [Bacillus sp. N9]